MLWTVAGLLTAVGFGLWILGSVFDYVGIAMIGSVIILATGAMIANGGYAELHVYPGEGHGLRNAANVRSAARSELAFVRGMLGR